MDIEAIYIHIPFCIRKCNYCDFVSYPISGLPVEEYCEAVIAEAALYAGHLDCSQKKIKSIYIGGGTPTTIPVKRLARILDQVRTFFPLEQGGEVTVECNPKTVNLAYLTDLKKSGVSRLSLGAQSFDQVLLNSMGRIHYGKDIKNAVCYAQRCGITNINLDLIYGLPGQTLNQWRASLSSALSLNVPHIAAYGLKLSQESSWGKLAAKGCLKVPDEDCSADMLELAIDFLEEHGYQQYEISNFSRPGYFSIHNRVYWSNGNYLGLGVAASSHWHHVRQTNHRSLDLYLTEVQKGRFPIGDQETVDIETEMGETIFLGLRLREGLNLAGFQQRYGIGINQKYKKPVEKFLRLGLLEQNDHYLRLTRKKYSWNSFHKG